MGGRDDEGGLFPRGIEEGVGALVWSSLGWGRLTGKIRRDAPIPEGSRLHDTAQWGPPVDDERFCRVGDALDAVAAETGKSVPQIAIAWLLARPTVSSVINGARNETPLRDNIDPMGWELTADQIARLDVASDVVPAYPQIG